METVNGIFGLGGSTSMYFGGSIFDLRHFEIDKNMIDYVYNSLLSINKGHMPDLFAGTLWMMSRVEREFQWRQKSPMFKRCYECLGKDGFIHTTEFMTNKDVVPYILSHMRWYHDNVILHYDNYLNYTLYDNAVINKEWTVDPITIRYYLKIEGNSDTPSYLYLLGGSPELFDRFDSKNTNHIVSYYGYYRYLKIAKEVLGLDRVYERSGSIEYSHGIDKILADVEENLYEIL